jgi:hypothetical protein
MRKARRVFKESRWAIDRQLSKKEAVILKQDEKTKVNERKSEPKINEPVRELGNPPSDTPLFLREGSEGEKGNAQDEKDKSEE